MRSTDAVTPAPKYDEFGLFHENAQEFGIAFDTPPRVRRIAVEIEDGYALSALRWGSEDSPELVLLHGGARWPIRFVPWPENCSFRSRWVAASGLKRMRRPRWTQAPTR